jgi:CubicO group peptidase (beta-lactamase class C family)
LCAELQAEIDAGFIPGVVLRVQRHGQPVLTWALGWSDTEASRAMRPDTLFRIFSMTKPLASVAALMLVEDGCLRLDDPVQSCLPAFGHPVVTVAHLGPDLRPAQR